MADTDRAKAGNEGDVQKPKRREELDAILQRIAEHIAEVDRRQGAVTPASAAVPGAAEAAGAGAATAAPLRRTTRSTAATAPLAQPGNAASEGPAGMATTADGGDGPLLPVATAPVPAAAPRPAVADAAAHPISAGGTEEDTLAPVSDDLARDAAPVPSSHARAATSEPPALRSALKPQAAAVSPRRVSLRETEVPAGTNPIRPAARSDEALEPWDSQSAEALAKVYEAETALPPLRSALEAMGGASAPAPAARGPGRLPRPAAPPADAAAIMAAAPAADAGHTDARIAEMARRVEAALDRLAPREMVEALGQRFDGLAGKLAGASAQLARLDDIETRLGELGRKLSDEQIVALFGSLVPTAEELGQFADDAAAKAAERALEGYAQELAARPAAGKDATASLEIKALRELLGVFMDDRRRNDAGTQEALETLQLAMQHVLDRIDGAEGPQAAGRPDEGHAGPRRAEMPPPARPVAAMAAGAAALAMTAAVAAAPAEAAVADPYEYDPEMDRLGLPEPHDLDAVPDAPSYDEARPVAPGAPLAAAATATLAAAGIATAAAGEHAPSPAVRAAAKAAPEPAAAPEANDRSSFIAKARRAAEVARQEADSKTEQGGRGRAPKAAAATAATAGTAPSRPAAGVRPGVLMATGLAAFALAGYWLVASPKVRLAGSPPAISREEAPATGNTPAASPSGVPDIEDEKPARGRPAPRSQAGARPDRTADEVQPASGGAAQEEARVIDGPVDPGSLGIALAHDQAATPDALMRARNQQHLANLSHRAAFTASQQHPAIATSAVSDRDAAGAPATQPAEPIRLELPPAALGPLSLRVAAAKGDPSAQLEIATRYAEGKGIKQSFAEAVVWYQRAAMQGLAVAQYRLATLQERGMGAKADPARARVWYQRAAEGGNLKAMHNLAVMSASQTGGTPDYDTAARLFTDAAERGLADSQYNLAILAESGLGMQKDQVAAYKWYTLAAKAGDREAGRRRDQLIGRLTQDMIQEGERQAATWRARPADLSANDARAAAEAWKQRTAANGGAPVGASH